MMVPSSVYNRASGMSDPTLPSPFILELPNNVFDKLNESYGGGLEKKRHASSNSYTSPSYSKPSSTTQNHAATKPDPKQLGFCKHKIFGKGKIIARPEPNKYKVNFPGFGIKTIIGDYLELL